jgi:hypothetical protein
MKAVQIPVALSCLVDFVHVSYGLDGKVRPLPHRMHQANVFEAFVEW